jgi:hypothetical protein
MGQDHPKDEDVPLMGFIPVVNNVEALRKASSETFILTRS